MPWLLKFSIGPVQDFIAASRKLEDLCSGSCLLSQLMEAAIKAAEQEGAKVIYPCQPETSGDEMANLPNVLLAETTGEGKVLASKVGERVRKRFGELIHEHIDETQWDSAQVKAQIDGFLDITWAAIALGPDFHKSMEALNQHFDAAKRTRVFRQQSDERVCSPKCTLQPELDVLRLPGMSDYGQIRALWKDGAQLPKAAQKAIQAGKGERFSAIGLAKRCFGPDNDPFLRRFPSTYSIATAAWRRDLQTRIGAPDALALTKVLQGFEGEFRVCLGNGDWQVHKAPPNAVPGLLCSTDGQAWSEGAIQKKGLDIEPQLFTETDSVEPVPVGADPLRQVRQGLLEEARKAGLSNPPKHYALLLADGDWMGRVVDARTSVADLRKLSVTLHEFCTDMTTWSQARERCGRLIYAGGDDLMAVFPIASALEAACYWQAEYAGRMREYGFELEGCPVQPSLSVAVMIAPTKYPLHRLLREAHEVLAERAKQDHKNAISIAVYKGDSEASAVTLPGRVGDWSLDVWMKTAGERLTSRELSSKAVHDLYALLEQLTATREAERMHNVTATPPDPEWIANLVQARLATNRDLEKDEAKRAHNLARAFMDAMKQELQTRGKLHEPQQRFAWEKTLGPALLTARNLSRLAAPSSGD